MGLFSKNNDDEKRFAQKYGGVDRWTTDHGNGMTTHGSTEPVLTVLDVRGFELKYLFLIGMNSDCGRIMLPTQARAFEAQAALEPAYSATVVSFELLPGEIEWAVDYSRRDLDGSETNRFVTDIVLKDGRVAMKDGRWVR